MKENRILTKKAISIINKKMHGHRLNQQDSNYLSRFVRPKLRDIAAMDAKSLLIRLDYNPKSRYIEKKIRELVLNNLSDASAIIICGSVIQTNYNEYNDIDIIIATRKVIKDEKGKKDKLIERIISEGKNYGLNLDVQIYAKKSIINQYSYNPSLIYQLKDCKVIYGKFDIPKKVELSNLDLKMKMDWSEDMDIYSKGGEIYLALRNAMLVLLLMNKKIDNYQLKENIINAFGVDLVSRLKNDEASKSEKRLVLYYLKSLIKYIEDELNRKKWEKIVIENP